MAFQKKLLMILFYYTLFFSIVNGVLSFRFETVFDIPFYVSLVTLSIIAVSVPITSSLERYHPRTKYLYLASNILFGSLVISFPIVVLEMILSYFFRRSFWIFALIPLLVIYSLFKARNIVVNYQTIRLKGLKRSVNLALITDIHLGAINSKGLTERIIDKLQKVAPDALLIGGDIFDGSGIITKDLLRPFSKLKIPILAVLGNHDLFVGANKVTKILRELDIMVLRSQTKRLFGIDFIGVDSLKFETKNSVNEELLKMRLPAKKTRPRVLLFHTPNGIPEAKKRGIDLMLSGHTHAGQIFPFTVLIGLQARFVKGLYDLGDLKLFVSEGVGTWGPPMRLGSKSEITIFELIPKK